MGVLDDIEGEASATVAHADVCADGRLLADYLEARQALSRSQPEMLEDDDYEAAARRLADLHEQVKARTHRYTFQCVDRPTREGLTDQYPPSDAQRKQGFLYDPAGFEPALAAVSLVEIDGEPHGEDEDRLRQHFDALYQSMPEGPNGWGAIAQALEVANYEGTQVPKSVSDIGDRFVSALNSTGALAPESG